MDIYFIDFDSAKIYYLIQEDGTVISKDKAAHITREKFLDYLAVAKELGHKTGKL